MFEPLNGHYWSVATGNERETSCSFEWLEQFALSNVSNLKYIRLTRFSFFACRWAAGIVGPHLGAILGVFLFRLACDHYSETAEKDRTKECTFRIDDPSKRANESTTSIC